MSKVPLAIVCIVGSSSLLVGAQLYQQVVQWSKEDRRRRNHHCPAGRLPAQTTELYAGFGGDQTTRGEVVDVGSLLEEHVETTCRRPAQVDSAGSDAADVADPRQDSLDHRGLPRAHGQRVAEPRAREGVLQP